MICWVYISKSSNCLGPLFVYYDKVNSDEYFGMAILNAKLAVYKEGVALPYLQSEILASNHWLYVGVSYDHKNKETSLWVNGTKVQREFNAEWTFDTGYRAVRMGAVYLQNWDMTCTFKGRITVMQVYNVSLNKRQIEAVKYVSSRGKNTKCKAGKSALLLKTKPYL